MAPPLVLVKQNKNFFRLVLYCSGTRCISLLFSYFLQVFLSHWSFFVSNFHKIWRYFFLNMQMHFHSKRREKKKSIKRSIILAYSILFQLVTNRCLYSFIVNWFNCFAARCVVLDLLGGYSFLTFKGRNTIFGYICRSGKVLLLRMCLAFLKNTCKKVSTVNKSLTLVSYFT